MLAPAEILQMEDQLNECDGPRRRTSHDFALQRLKVAGGALPRTMTGIKVALAAALILLGTYFAGHALFIQAKAVVAQVLLEQAWDRTLATGKPAKAWAWADTWPVAKLTFPRLNQSAIVLEDAGGEALAFGPAHVAGTAKPGTTGVSVIGGHRDTHFTFIKDLKVGDAITVQTADGATHHYKVTGSTIVHARASGIGTDSTKPRLALVTCYPFDAVQRGPLRYVVFAELTPRLRWAFRRPRQ